MKRDHVALHQSEFLATVCIFVLFFVLFAAGEGYIPFKEK